MSKKVRAFGLCVGFAMMAYAATTYQAYDPAYVLAALSLSSLMYLLCKIIWDSWPRQYIKPPPPEQVQKTSPNNRLFVPPPLDK
jgi:hypothetical protein